MILKEIVYKAKDAVFDKLSVLNDNANKVDTVKTLKLEIRTAKKR